MCGAAAAGAAAAAAGGSCGAAGGAPAGGCRRAVLADDGERGADRHLRPRLDEQLLDHAAREDLDLDVGLVGVDDGDDVARG